MTNFEAFVSTVKVYLGIGFLFVPGAFRQLGLFAGIIGTLSVAFISGVSAFIIIDVLEMTGHKYKGYSSLVEGVLGNKSKWILEISVIMMQLFFPVCYFNYFAE